jgi:hypothetical protein
MKPQMPPRTTRLSTITQCTIVTYGPQLVSASVVDCGRENNFAPSTDTAATGGIHAALIDHPSIVVAKCPNGQASRPGASISTVSNLSPADEDYCQRLPNERQTSATERKDSACLTYFHAYCFGHAAARMEHAQETFWLCCCWLSLAPAGVLLTGPHLQILLRASPKHFQTGLRANRGGRLPTARPIGAPEGGGR